MHAMHTLTLSLPFFAARRVVSECPSLQAGFKALWWAHGPHAQTFAGRMKKRHPESKSEYRREMLELTCRVQVCGFCEGVCER
jgi:hypothetical protein